MHVSSIQKLTLLALIVVHLSLLCGAYSRYSGRRGGRYGGGFRGRNSYYRRGRTYPRINVPSTTFAPCPSEESSCNELGDCLLPRFQCVGNGRCVSRSWQCNGIIDCNDGSDEWGCQTTYLDFTTNATISSESDEDTSLNVTTETVSLDTELKTSLSYLTTANTVQQNFEVDTTATNNIFPKSEEFTTLSSTITTSTMISLPEKNSVTPFSITDPMRSNSESSIAMSSLTTTATLPSNKWRIIVPSLTTTNIMFSDFESNTAVYKADTTKSTFPYSESITTSKSTTLPKKTSIAATNTIIPDSSAIKSCPENYCMQNAECLVVQDQYLCKCPSSFIGEHCEIQLGSEERGHGYVMPIVIFCILVVLSLAIVSGCVCYCKRLSTRKYADMSNRSLSQLNLTSNAIE